MTDAIIGAKEIITNLLNLKKQSTLVIILDETTIEPARHLIEAAQQLEINYLPLFIPTEIQAKVRDVSSLPERLASIIRDTTAIITCVTGVSNTMRFRESIFEIAHTAKKRIGHMPGANIKVIEAAAGDIEEIVRKCRALHYILNIGEIVEIHTTASDGKSHILTIDISNCQPDASTGIIQNGSWGNVPSGETFVCPNLETSSGSIVINGSLPGHVIEEEIVLVFEQGRVKEIYPEDSKAYQYLEESQLKVAQAVGDTEWNVLAELGIGVNDAVRELTGNMLLDEKALGTLHIAIGSNTFMGGQVDSEIHCDMVVTNAMMTVDKKVLLKDGKLNIDDNSQWMLKINKIDTGYLKDYSAAKLAGVAVRTMDGKLMKRLNSEAGRTQDFFVGDDDTSKLCNTLYHNLKPNRWTTFEQLAKKLDWEFHVVMETLAVLDKHNMVVLK